VLNQLPEKLSNMCVLKRPLTNKILLIGGKTTGFSKKAIWYDIPTKNFSYIQDEMSFGRERAACAIHEEIGKVIVVGGYIYDSTSTINKSPSTKSEMFDLATEQWNDLNDLPLAILFYVVIDRKLFIYASEVTYAYDWNADQWINSTGLIPGKNAETIVVLETQGSNLCI
jgi:hypothetical protein